MSDFQQTFMPDIHDFTRDYDKFQIDFHGTFSHVQDMLSSIQAFTPDLHILEIHHERFSIDFHARYSCFHTRLL